MNPETEIVLNFLRTSGVSIPPEGSIKKQAKRLRKLVTQDIALSSVRVRSLALADGEVPVLVYSLFRAALKNVDWYSLAEIMGGTSER